MAESPYIVVLITASNAEEAGKIADRILVQRRAACVNIIPGVSSVFWWNGKLDSAQEHLLVIKTKMAQLEEITGLVKKLHSYQVPEIIALPITGGNSDYLEWIDREVKG